MDFHCRHYPGIDLKLALQRSHALYQVERNHAAPVETILAHWGYKANSGKGLVILAALKKFGLLLDEGSGKGRKARLSEDAIKIVLDTRPETGDRYKAMSTDRLFSSWDSLPIAQDGGSGHPGGGRSS